MFLVPCFESRSRGDGFRAERPPRAPSEVPTGPRSAVRTWAGPEAAAPDSGREIGARRAMGVPNGRDSVDIRCPGENEQDTPACGFETSSPTQEAKAKGVNAEKAVRVRCPHDLSFSFSITKSWCQKMEFTPLVDFPFRCTTAERDRGIGSMNHVPLRGGPARFLLARAMDTVCHEPCMLRARTVQQHMKQ